MHKNLPHSETSKGKGHPIMFGKPQICKDFGDFPEGGGYPQKFLPWVYELMKVTDPSKVLHLCSGSVLTGIRVDIRKETKPDIIGDCRKVPLPDCSFDFILADPPYSKEYAKNLYSTEEFYPSPFDICKEASRLLTIGGKFGLMHFQVPMFRKPLRLISVYGITQGLGYNIRAWSLFTKD